MRAIIWMTLCFYFMSVVLAVISVKESDITAAAFAALLFIVASFLVWQLTQKYRANKRGFWVSVGLLLLSLFMPHDL